MAQYDFYQDERCAVWHRTYFLIEASTWEEALIKAAEPFDGCLAVAYIDGEFTLKRVRIEPGRIRLVLANPNYPAIEIGPDEEFFVWGVVRWGLKQV